MSERKATTSDRLHEIMLSRGIRQADIVEACQPFCKKYSIPVSKNDISQYVRGITEPKQDKLTILGLALDVSEVWLMGYNVPQSREDFNRLSELPSNVLPVAKKRLPMLGNIACGEPTYAEEDWEGFVEVGADINADFCIRAKGDSMIGARIFDGDIIFIHKQDMVENGEIAAVLIEDEATLKRVSYDQDAGILTLYPENPMYKPLRYEGPDLNNIRILGKAVSCQFDIN